MFGALLDETADRYGDRIALAIEGGASLTYRELGLASADLATKLRSLGVTPRQSMMLRLPSDHRYLITYCALARLGAITAGVSPKLTEAEAASIRSTLQPDHVMTVELFDDLAALPPQRAIALDVDAAVGEGDAVAIVFTSGTTGPAKGAIFRRSQIEAICEADLGPKWKSTWNTGGAMIVSTQFAHVGFMTKLWWYLRCGLTLWTVPRWSPGAILELIERERVSALGAIAPQLAIMMGHPRFAHTDVSSVQMLIVGGAFSPPRLIERAIAAFNALYSVRYSSTESGGVGLSIDYGASSSVVPNCIGTPRPPVEARIVDEAGVPVDTGEVGELCLRSPTMADGYWNHPDATAETFRNGWLHTGDLATQAPSGEFVLAGRRSEMYLRGGYNVYPSEVEAALGRHRDIRHIAIVAQHDEILGEVGHAFVELEPTSAGLTLDSIRTFGAESLATYKLPEALTVLDSMPMTANSKIDLIALRSKVSS